MSELVAEVGTTTTLGKLQAPIIIEMERQTEEAVAELINEGKGSIYDSVNVALEQMKAQGMIEGAVVPVFIVISPSVV
jgi:hypothetical protein